MIFARVAMMSTVQYKDNAVYLSTNKVFDGIYKYLHLKNLHMCNLPLCVVRHLVS